MKSFLSTAHGGLRDEGYRARVGSCPTCALVADIGHDLEARPLSHRVLRALDQRGGDSGDDGVVARGGEAGSECVGAGGVITTRV